MMYLFNMKRNIIKYQFALSALLFLTACGSAGGKHAQWYTPRLGTTWQWQLSGKLNTHYDVNLYDIDLFTTSKEAIEAMHRDGRRVICYFSAGSYESWRPDAGVFPAGVRGKKMDGWDELWLDIRQASLRPIMQARLDLARDKGCDGVEPDNVDGYANETGFPLTADDQLAYNRFLATEAHARGLAIGLKNDLDQIPQLVSTFDFAVNEQCHKFEECDKLSPFVAADKAVLNAEYQARYVADTDGARTALCRQAKQEHFATLVLPLMLDDQFRYACSTEANR